MPWKNEQKGARLAKMLDANERESSGSGVKAVLRPSFRHSVARNGFVHASVLESRPFAIEPDSKERISEPVNRDEQRQALPERSRVLPERNQALLEQHRVEIRALNEQLIKVQEAERMRIAGELHDGVLQQITSLVLRLGKVKRQVPPDSEAKSTIGGLQQELIKVGMVLRHISHEMHPALLQEAGLPAALSAYCEEFTKVRGLLVSSVTDQSVEELSPGAALCLYRIAQEALGNAAKYSEAKKVEVRLTRSNGTVCLSVSDDGIGCAPDQLGKSGGLGVINMRERVLQLRGTFEFKSKQGRGTTVKAEVPFRPAS